VAQTPAERNLPEWGHEQAQTLRDQLATADPGLTWDLVVIGAGISGAGVARDAALRGLRVLVLDANDLAYGTSSRSSRLIHGGLRYLEQGELRLVFEALRERRRLYRQAPHLVQPARFLFPAYAGDRIGPFKLRVGLTLYDSLSLFRDEPHEFLDSEATQSMEPLLATTDLLGAVCYEDALTNDARLTLAVLQDARRHGAEVLTYAAVDRIEGEGSMHCVVLENGTRVLTRQAVVATGPWTGQRLLGSAGEGLLTLSKGIHIVMRWDDVPVRRPVVVQSRRQRRILFVVPWGRRTYLGTTDAPFEGDPGQSGVTVEDEDELLGLVGRLLPSAPLRRDRIVSAWSGVRPLVRGMARKHTGDTVELPRTHRVVETEEGVLGIVGGKLTTFRSMAEDLVNRACERLRRDWPEGRPLPRACSTHELPLLPGERLGPRELQDPLLGDLALRHGPNARMLASRVLARPVVDELPFRWVEIEQAVLYEGCANLDDVLRRRLPIALKDTRRGGGVARRVAEQLVDARGGNEADVREQIVRYRAVVELETRRPVELSP